MQDNGFISPWRAAGLAVIAAAGAGVADVHAQAAQDAENAFAAESPEGQEGHPLDGAALDFHRSGSNHGAEIGRASYYSGQFQGHRTASGEAYDMHALTAAHRTLPLGSYARVSNLSKTKSVIVRINDRGPFVRGRMLDVSYAAASELGLLQPGSAEVILEPVGQHVARAKVEASPKPMMLRIAHHPRHHVKHTHHERHAHGRAGHSHGRIQCGGTRAKRA